MEQMAHSSTLSSRESHSQNEFSRGEERESSSGFHRELRVWARDLVVALGLAMIIIVFFYQPVKVEGTSMAPLLSDQERIFINKFVYHFEPIGRGDVVVFWYPLDRTKSFIKRVVGLPGDEVEIRRGRVYINGKTLEEPYVPSQYIDTAAYGPVQIPRDEYFVWAIIASARMIREFLGRCRPHLFTAKPSLPTGLGLSSVRYHR